MKEYKSLKIYPKVHTELKVFVAAHPEWDMSIFASQAILKMLREQGHKFVYPNKKSKL